MNYDKKLFIKHLQGMVQIPTVSSADPEKTRVEEFLKLHAYLEEAYPLLHKTFKQEIIGQASASDGSAPGCGSGGRSFHVEIPAVFRTCR